MRLLLLLLVACGRPLPALPDTPPPTTSPILLVANKADATVSLIELPGGRVLATLATGVGPHEIAVSPDGRRAVVTNYGDQATLGRSLTVIDLQSLQVASTIDLGELRRPHGIAFVDEHRVAITAEVNAAVAIVDIDTKLVEKRVSTSQEGCHMLALSGDRKSAFVANIGSGSVTAIDLVAGTAGDPVKTLPKVEGIGVAGNEVWVGALQLNRIAILDLPGLTADGEIEAAGTPIRLTPTPDGKTMIVANAMGSVVQLVDTATRQATPIALPALAGPSAVPVGTVVSNDGKTAYVALVAENRVAVIDLASKTVSGHLTTGNGPDGIAYSSAFVTM